MSLSTRIPKAFGAAPTAPAYAWERNSDGDLVPTGATNLRAGQAWENTATGDLVPTGATITDDPYWEINDDGDLVPKAS